MSTKKVIVYFEDERDALHFTVAASSLISGEPKLETGNREAMRLIRPLARANRIRISRGATTLEPQPAA